MRVLFDTQDAHYLSLSILAILISSSILLTFITSKKIIKSRTAYLVWLGFWGSSFAHCFVELFNLETLKNTVLLVHTLFTIFALISWKLVPENVLEQTADKNVVSELEKYKRIAKKLKDDIEVREHFISDLRTEIIKLDHEVSNYKHTVALLQHSNYSTDKLNKVTSDIKSISNEV